MIHSEECDNEPFVGRKSSSNNRLLAKVSQLALLKAASRRRGRRREHSCKMSNTETEKFVHRPEFLWLLMIPVLTLFIFGCTAPIESIPTETLTPTPTNTPEPQKSAIEVPGVFGVGSTKISEKDGMMLYYVPAGSFEMGSQNKDDDERPVHTVYLNAFWIDETEVTNAMYAQCVADGKCKLPTSTASNSRENYYGNPEYDNYPVIYVSWDDATTYCEWAGRRLPTEAEWEKAASWDEVNQTKAIYPWGDSIDCSLANYANQGSDCVGETVSVGSYEGGRSQYGAYDMTGNVWEWTSSLYQPYPYEATDGREDPISLDLRVLRGGSWRNLASDVRSANRFKFDHSNTFPYVGFRCADSPKDGMVMVHVPAGEFTMGNNAEESFADCQKARSDCDLDWFKDEEPPHSVYLDAYWIDQTEVTNAMYAQCVADGSCDSPSSIRSATRDYYYGNPEYIDYPVVYVSWQDAASYCEWTGRRLPTEAEWEKAASWDAKQQKKNIYPWGDAFGCQYANFPGCGEDLTPVGNYESGQSPYGVYDMAGNAWEWVADWYDVYLGGDAGASVFFGKQFRVLRGGMWNSFEDFARASNRFYGVPLLEFNSLGFRCASSFP